jgi:hypothetical protein
MTQSFDPLSAADLETNKAGRLTDQQRKNYRTLERAFRKNELVGGIMCGIVAALFLTETGPAPNAQYRPFVGVGLAVVAAFLLIRGLFLNDKLTSDLRAGKVDSVEGAITKYSRSANSGGSSSTSYYLEVAGRRFEVAGITFHAAPDAGYVRLYVLPKSHRVVNMERLPDPPVPAGVFSSPTEALGIAMTAFRSHDPIQAAEARAELAAVGHQWQAARAAAATPPPADQRDPRPLAEAIVGTWQTGPISMTFMPDGTVVALLPGGRKQNGRWSIGPDGKLRSNATGSDQVADAWVAGDTLSISENGQGMAFRRSAGV